MGHLTKIIRIGAIGLALATGWTTLVAATPAAAGSVTIESRRVDAPRNDFRGPDRWRGADRRDHDRWRDHSGWRGRADWDRHGWDRHGWNRHRPDHHGWGYAYSPFYGPRWVPPQWVWNGWGWVLMPGYWR